MIAQLARILVAAVASLSLLTGCVPTAAADDTPPTPALPAVMTLNVHGGLDRQGGGNRGRPTNVTADVLTLVALHQPTVIALQELCGRQYRDLRTKLSRLGYAGTFTNTQASAGCSDRARGNQFGNGIFIKGAIQTRYVWALPWGANAKGVTGRQPRRLLCVKPIGETWRACVTHLSPHAPDVTRQAAKVVSAIARWGGRVIVAGDFNLSPKWIGRTFPGYSDAGEGIDHVISSTAATVVAVEHVPSSDHDALVAAVA